ncbi:AIM24 family protein [Yinghuangia seranimata]|uniref:AIM24 family protein n=1 Tax=Yinghuangia seranimata TaxID=408067 RepID=UPI00248B7EE4|nr:AIM24 family protein [Yinghuangia seranimata]MDI2128027.1 AIM24 family protein [Yinghuangia seranimata]
MDQQMIAAYGQTAPTARMQAHGNKICRVAMQQGYDLFAKQGSMIAYTGFITFNPWRDSRGQRARGAITGEKVELMQCTGQGDLYLADYGADVVMLQLNGEALSVNGANILAFDAQLTKSIESIPGLAAKFSGNGMFNIKLEGTGWVAITTQGTPVVLNPGERETYVDPDALVAWSSGLRVKTKSSMRAMNLIGRGSGEAMQVAFTGSGYVVVQPSEDSTDRFHIRG